MSADTCDPVANVINAMLAEPLISEDFKRGLRSADKTHREMADFLKRLRGGTAHGHAGGCQGCADNMMEDAAEKIEQQAATNAEVLLALIKLSNEVLGSLPLMEPLARREFGNTNYNILIQRAKEARAVIAKATAT